MWLRLQLVGRGSLTEGQTLVMIDFFMCYVKRSWNLLYAGLLVEVSAKCRQGGGDPSIKVSFRACLADIPGRGGCSLAADVTLWPNKTCCFGGKAWGRLPTYLITDDVHHSPAHFAVKQEEKDAGYLWMMPNWHDSRWFVRLSWRSAQCWAKKMQRT